MGEEGNTGDINSNYDFDFDTGKYASGGRGAGKSGICQ